MPGIMEFVIASAALHMKEQGAEVMSLSGAPLATKPGEDPDSLVRKEGKSGFDALRERAMPLSDFFVEHLSAGIAMGGLMQIAGFTSWRPYQPLQQFVAQPDEPTLFAQAVRR